MINITRTTNISLVQTIRSKFWTLLSVAIVGCGSAQPQFEAPDTFPFVQCTIEMSGEPVHEAIVAFHGKNGSEQIIGAFDNDNDCYRFVTKTGNTVKGGVPEGTYTVTVKPGRGTKVKIPARYADPAKSDLKAEIEAGENLLNFDLSP